MYLFSDLPNHAAAHIVRPVRMPVQLRYGRPTPRWSFRPAGKAGHKPAAWPEDLGPYMVPYLKRKRSRLITGHILVRGQGEPPDLQSRLAIGMIAATIQRPAKQLRLRCGLGERQSGSLLEFQPLFCCNLLEGVHYVQFHLFPAGGGANNLALRQIARAGGDSYDC